MPAAQHTLLHAVMTAFAFITSHLIIITKGYTRAQLSVSSQPWSAAHDPAEKNRGVWPVYPISCPFFLGIEGLGIEGNRTSIQLVVICPGVDDIRRFIRREVDA